MIYMKSPNYKKHLRMWHIYLFLISNTPPQPGVYVSHAPKLVTNRFNLKSFKGLGKYAIQLII